MANSYLSRSVSSAGNRKTFTLSAWVKRGIISSGEHNIFGNSDSGYNNGFAVKFNSSDQLRVIMQDSSNYEKKPNRVFRDLSAWYHLVIQVDTTQSTATDRVKIWVNGVQETSFATDTMPSQNYDTHWNNTTQTTTVGRSGNYNGDYYDGYITHASNVDGSVVAPTVFGQTDSTSGIWKFKSPSGVTWGTNGFHLKMENSGNMGLDSSGQTNNFSTNGNLKQALDTPSDSYTTLNGAFNLSDNVLSYGNNKVVNANSNWKYVPATLGVESGKWYAEYKVNKSSGYIMNGVVDMQYAVSQDQNSYTHSGAGTGSVSIYSDSGQKYIEGTNTDYAGTYTTNDIIGVALDMDNSKVYFSKNGAWANGSGGWGSSTFDAAVGAISLPTTGTYTFAVSQRSGAYNEVNFGNGLFGITAISSAGSNGNGSLFEYDVPSGYYALNTKNLNTYG
jgi:hypothetical protein